MENAVIEIDWYVSIDKVKTVYKDIKLVKDTSPVVLEQLEWGELRWDRDLGLQLATTTELFGQCFEWLEVFHKKHKVKKVWVGQSQHMRGRGSILSIIHCEIVEGYSDAEADKFFEKFGLERDGFTHGYPLPAKKKSHGNRKDIKVTDTTGATTRWLELGWNKDRYVGHFKKYVSSDIKVEALVEMTLGVTNELVLQSAIDMLRSGNKYPSDTYRSIQKQCNELFAKR